MDSPGIYDPLYPSLFPSLCHKSLTYLKVRHISGGTIEEFTVGFCGQYHYCSDIMLGDIVLGTANIIGVPAGDQPICGVQWITPKSFKPGEMLRLTVP
jgi:hypothetical protein